MKSYIILQHSADGASPSEVREKLLSLGFKPTVGLYDYEYEWDKSATTDECIYLADNIQRTLQGMNVMFKLESV